MTVCSYRDLEMARAMLAGVVSQALPATKRS
jgi:hypothetical protein